MADLIISSFNAGFLSPLLDGRSDLEKYYFGARLYDNFIPLPYGPAERRPGTYFVAECKNNDKKARLVPFQFSTEQAYVHEYGDEYIRFFKDRGQILHGVGTEDISALDNQIAHWLLNETSGVTIDDDVAVVPHDGTSTVDCETLHADGKVGTGCFDLDGQYTVEITDHNDFSFTDNADDDPFSIACWAYVTQQANVQVLLSKWRDKSTEREWRFSINNERKLQLHLADTSADLSGNGIAQWKLNDDAANTNVISSGPTYTIDDADAVANTFTISDDGDLTASFPDGSEFTVEGSTGNDGQYTVVGTAYGAPDFVITVAAVADGTDNGSIAPHAGVATANTDTFNATGKISGALDFGGQYAVEIDDSADFSFGDGTNDSAFSIAAWVYVVNASTSQVILAKADGTTGAEVREWVLSIDYHEHLKFVLWDESANSYIFATSGDSLSSGWHFVVATYDGGEDESGITIYVDNIEDTVNRWHSGTYTAMENLATKVVIGANEQADGNLGNYWRDKIDNVIIFDIELNQANVSALWNDSNGTELMPVYEVSAVADTPLSLGWHFLACTYSAPATEATAANGIILYEDSAAVDSTKTNDATYTAMQNGGEEIRIGSQRNSGDSANENFWGDKIDEVSVFKDVLTPTEIASLYSTTAYEISSNYLEADLFGLQHTQSADVLYNVHGSYPQSKLIRYEHNLWELNDIVFDWPPFLDENITDTTIISSATVGTVELTASTPIFTSDHIGSFWLIKHPRSDNKVEKQLTTDFSGFATTGATDILVDVEGSWRMRTSDTWTGTVELERSYDGQFVLVLDAAPAGGIWSTDDIITGATSGDTCIIVSATDTTHYYIKQLSGSFTDGEVLSNQIGNSRDTAATWPRYEGWHTLEPVKSVQDQNFNLTGEETLGGAYLRAKRTVDNAGNDPTVILSVERFYHYGIVKITGFTNATSASAMVIRTLGSTSATKLWSEGIWSDERGYPVTTAFYEGRLWFAGTSYRPLDILGSRVNDYENVKTGTLDDDAVKFTVDSSMQNMIRWLVGQEVLLIGTSGGEWRLGSTDPADAITPTNPMRPRIQTTYGSKEIQALLLANAVLFVDAQGRKVRGAQYIFEKGESGGYDAPDYTMLSEHITESGIVDMAFQQNPYPILWCVRDDGVLIGMVFEPGQKVWGWFRCVIDGDVESVAVIKGVTEDEVWIIVKREINGSDKRYVEYFKPRDWGDDQADCFFVDSGLTFDGGDAVTITGISKANPGVITAVAHGFSDGDQVKIDDVIGMTDVNNKVFSVITPPYWFGVNGSHLDSSCGDDGGLGTAGNALYGTTIWTHEVNETHWFIIDLGYEYNVTKVRGRSNYVRDPTDVKIYVSTSKDAWGAAVATGITTWQDTDAWIEIDVTDKVGRYVKIEIVDTENVSKYLTFGGINDISIFDVYVSSNDIFKLRDKLDSTDWDTSGYDIYVSGGTVEQVDNAFSGLDHLEGKTVSVLGDGSVHEDVVVSSGAVTLTEYYNKVHIGLPFTSSLKPMKLAVPGANIRGKVKRIHQIIFSFYKTLGGKFGPTVGDETIPFRKTTDPMGSPPPLFTGEKIQTFPGGYELEGDIYVEQTQPLPMTVRSITARLGIFD